MPEETSVRRRGRARNPITTSSDDIPITPSEIVPNSSSIENLPINLPDEIVIQLPDFAGSAASAVGFSPNPALPRITDAQRSEDERAFREMANAAKNLKDSITVASEYVSAGIAATKLGQRLIQYKAGIADIRTALVGLQKSETKTAIAQAELAQLNETLAFQNGLLPQIQAEYQHKLTEAQGRADRARRKAESYLTETENLFPMSEG